VSCVADIVCACEDCGISCDISWMVAGKATLLLARHVKRHE
jgi:hypothetical protein